MPITLLEAIQTENYSEAERLIKEGTDVNLRYKDRDTLLIIAARKNNSALVELLLKNGAQADQANDLGEVPILLAAQNGDNAAIEHLQRYDGLNLNYTNARKQSALWLACKNGHADTVQLLIKYGADINQKDIEGNTPIAIAVISGHEDILSLLLDYKATIHSGSNTVNPLYIAARNGSDLMVGMLLFAGAQPNLPTDNGDTPLCAAVENGHEDVVAALKDAGANMNHQRSNGDTPLLIAARMGYLELVKFFDNDKSKHSFTESTKYYKEVRNALFIATSTNHPHVVEYLICKLEIAERLLKSQIIEVTAKDQYVRNNASEYTRTADFNISNVFNDDGETLLFVAAKFASNLVIEILFKHQVDANRKTMDEDFPLGIAVEKGHESTTEFLLEHGADPEQMRTSGQTLMDIALENKHYKIAAILAAKTNRIAPVPGTSRLNCLRM